MKRPRGKGLRAACAGLALGLGLVTNSLSLAAHYGLLGFGCGRFGCTAAALDPRSVFPPRTLFPASDWARVPVALVAWGLFAAVALQWLRQGWGGLLARALLALGALVYLPLSLSQPGPPCWLCLTSHAAALGVCVSGGFERDRVRREWPSLALAAALAGALALALRPDTDALVDEWRASRPVQAGGAPLVVFTDPACGACQAFAQFLPREVARHGASVEIQWRALGPGAHAQDAAAARALKVERVPTVYLEGRRVPARAAVWTPFWRVALAD